MTDVYDLLCILSVPGIGPLRIRRLIGHFGSAKAVLDADVHDLCLVEGIDENKAERIKKKINRLFADDQLSRVEKHKVRLITLWDADYPEILKSIYDAPVLLYVKGTLDGKNGNRLAVVGTRSSTSYGQWAAEYLCEDLARRGVVIVSGMARGIDTLAHRGAIKGGGKTIAVLGSGVDVVYPPENDGLYERISETGAVISEFPMNTEPASGHFPRRNRIISGLSVGTVVVEADHKSGALITAYIALEQGREVFAVPGSIRSRTSRGTHKLIKEGAKLVESVDDILAEMPQWKSDEESGQNMEDVSERLSEEERVLWDVLSEEPLHIDGIAAQANVTTSEALAMLLSMELKNCVKQFSGMMFVRL